MALALVRVCLAAAEIAYTSRFSPTPRGVSISSKFVTCCLVAFLTLIGPGAHAQSVPEAPPSVAAALEPTPDAVTATATSASVATATTVAAAVVTGIDALEGKVSYFASKFTGRKTASGERFNPNEMTMAHKTLAFGTRVRVTNLLNGKSVQVRVNDRGPFVAGRVADLSHAAARQLDLLRLGVAHARLEILGAHD